VIQGNFKNNRLGGQGKMTMPCGSYYEGQFKNSKRHGQGKFVDV